MKQLNAYGYMSPKDTDLGYISSVPYKTEQEVEIPDEKPPLAEYPVTSSIRPVILWYIVEKNSQLNLSETTVKKGDISYTFIVN